MRISVEVGTASVNIVLLDEMEVRERQDLDLLLILPDEIAIFVELDHVVHHYRLG